MTCNSLLNRAASSSCTRWLKTSLQSYFKGFVKYSSLENRYSKWYKMFNSWLLSRDSNSSSLNTNSFHEVWDSRRWCVCVCFFHTAACIVVDCAPAVRVVLSGLDRNNNIALVKQKKKHPVLVRKLNDCQSDKQNATYLKYISPEISRVTWWSLGK